MSDKKNTPSTVATNRKAFHDYTILDTFEAGISLNGPEVKSLRLRQASIEQSFAKAENGQIFLYNMRISPYEFNKLTAHDPSRTRRLLLRANEIKKLSAETATKGVSLIPLEVYFKRGWAKIKLGLAKGKQARDKREAIKRKDADREMRKSIKKNYR
ncbi:MAG: SsrA-binding protein SmpB [Elusimicrobia bacterium]|nr:SsrA-binding protein SmpB [Elusimicrobiota bacterium]